MGSLLSSSDEEEPKEGIKNLQFYGNKIHSRPWPGHTIEEMLSCFGKYYTLESNHRYIQWLFPIPGSRGMNSSAQPLYEHEAKAIREDPKMSARVLRAYKMMLNFYGMYLVSDLSGEVCRDRDNWKKRYKHLNRSTHNYRRITRILVSLGELGYERFQVPWVSFLIEESIVTEELPNLKAGNMRHWIDSIKDPKMRERLRLNYREICK